MRFASALILLFFLATTAHAETRYIVDQATMPMRAGKGTSFKIVKMLPSGMAIELLEQSSDGYSYIRVPGGKEGWILSRYLMKTPAARDRLIQVEQDLVQLKQIKQQLAETESERDSANAQNKKLSAELALIRKTSAEAASIAAENSRLKSEAQQLRETYDKMAEETREIRNGSQHRWFMLGGGAILVGITLGLLLPMVRYRRKDRWSRY